MLVDEATTTAPQNGEILAAIDIGSNSFHLVIARVFEGELKTLDVMSEKVQLAAGLDDNKLLSEESQQRGLDCLSRFAQRLSDIPRRAIRAVATNALREAQNRDEFAAKAERLLGLPLQIVSGHEEARLIYLGVSHTQADDTGQRLVVDIGGGSTEFIIGERFETRLLESLQMGCVSFSEEFFPQGNITKQGFNQAYTAAMQELLSIRRNYRRLGWDSCVGSSGTIKAVNQACTEMGYSQNRITRDALNQLEQDLLRLKHVQDIQYNNVKPERRAVLPAGVAILRAVFDSLDIREMAFSDGALREGVLYDMAGRLRHEDVRERTIRALMKRYQVDMRHASNIEATALILFAQARDTWQLTASEMHDMLCWSARTHEIGLTISHNRFHRHSAYLLQHSDLAGFSHPEQQMLAFLVRSHRRKLPKEELKLLPNEVQTPCLQLALLLRLAVILHRSRSKARLPALRLQVEEQKLHLTFPPGWLKHHPLTQADLEEEIEHLRQIDYKLKVD
ncbi:exopolyphosphatase [Nitrincola tapanii]|uniref:Exopolyphosphatase n=1 Tax=Nitrincola tapanii TaxID=1708751 RepID=A0A5A9W7V4_9GAMM|nr:exopolyphosphatase [Nitrincola tapanii]KAA0876198.1 exopolyphosphatase [Nitrincola tapanii]